MIHAFTVAAFLCALVSRVALALEGALRVDAVAVSTQPDVLTLVNVCLGENVMRTDVSLHLQRRKGLQVNSTAQ